MNQPKEVSEFIKISRIYTNVNDGIKDIKDIKEDDRIANYSKKSGEFIVNAKTTKDYPHKGRLLRVKLQHLGETEWLATYVSPYDLNPRTGTTTIREMKNFFTLLKVLENECKLRDI